MDFTLIMILILSSISVSTEQQRESLDGVPFPDAPPNFRRVEKIERDNDVGSGAMDPVPDVVDGNHPDNSEITTHDHVDKAMGHVPPTKRVKKILPPFEGPLRDSRQAAVAQVAESTTDSSEEEDDVPIRGIRLVPEDGVEGEGGEGEEEGPTMQKSIWDLLRERERERFNTEATHLDGVESSGNESEATSREQATTKSLYEHFDADSAEVEFEMGSLAGSNVERHELPLSYAMPWLQAEGGKVEKNIPREVSKLLRLDEVGGVENEVVGESGRCASKWYLLLLTGNATIVELRRQDFAKYLKLNLAARLSVEYDDVRVNKVILAPPKVLVNVSVFAPSDDIAEESELDFKVSDKGEALLYKLAETNATLLELSGEEYRVIRFLSFESQKPEAEAHKDVPGPVAVVSRQGDVEFIAYTFFGSACACAALLILFVTLSRYYKRVSDFAWFRPKRMAWKAHEDANPDKDEFDGVAPAVIYSGGFPQIRGSWMTGPARHSAPALRPPHPALDFAAASPPRPSAPAFPDIDERPYASPRHTRLHIYNCDADSLVIPMPLSGRGADKRGDSRPLDVRLRGESVEGGEDNPIFTN